ncbi:transcriptional regulator with XRE-family HTH domain [Nocardia transvalensis]|uniref:Transcriptional regulator with XRE-family HTH domain n=1 Tax=Nocardia transvalensis TaxID=37333 RepID=A0A7W9PLN0_9NOCA|nr:helix-turn-helix transcriptional regulator [Nocardia transvalensis]MBB5917753.1 transcriptional regulator with XRE-family HTH domain [Nocardia transvalensis]
MNEPISEPGPQSASIADQLAREIKCRRQAAGLSQRQLAAKIRYTRQYVGMAETADGVLPSRSLVAVLDAGLGADGALVTLRAQAHDEQRAIRVRNRTATSETEISNTTAVALPVIVEGRLVTLPLDSRTLGPACSNLVGPTDEHEDDAELSVINRRTLFIHGIAVATTGALDPDFIRNADAVESVIYSKNISERTITSFTAVTRLLAGQRQSIDPAVLLTLVSAHRNSVTALFRSASDERVKKQIGFLLGETSIVASRLWSAIGDRPMALASCAFAKRLADDIRDPALGGVARIFESNLRSDAATLIGSDGDIVNGLQLLREAAAVADALPPSARARIAAEQAQAFAVLGLNRECRDALARAGRAVDEITEPDQTGLFSDWNPTRLAVYEGTCWLFLNEPKKSITALTRAISTTTADNRNVVLAAQVDLASAHALDGELEEGCRMLGDAYETLVAAGNSRGVERAQCALGRLEPWKSETPIRELRERIKALPVS